MLARELVDRGAWLEILARTSDARSGRGVAMARRRHAEALVLVANVQSQEEVETAATEIMKAWGRIYVLTSVAGIVEVFRRAIGVGDHFHAFALQRRVERLRDPG